MIEQRINLEFRSFQNILFHLTNNSKKSPGRGDFLGRLEKAFQMRYILKVVLFAVCVMLLFHLPYSSEINPYPHPQAVNASADIKVHYFNGQIQIVANDKIERLISIHSLDGKFIREVLIEPKGFKTLNLPIGIYRVYQNKTLIDMIQAY